MTSPFDWNDIEDKKIQRALDLLVERGFLFERKVLGGQTRYYTGDLENFDINRNNAFLSNLKDIGYGVFIEVVSNQTNGEQGELPDSGVSVTQEIVDGDADWPPVIAVKEKNENDKLSSDIASRHVLALINQRQQTLSSADSLSKFFEDIIETYLNESGDNRLPEDWQFLSEIKVTLRDVTKTPALDKPRPDATEIEELNEHISELEAKILALEAKIKEAQTSETPVGTFLNNMAASGGKSIGPLASVSMIFLLGVPVETIVATAALLHGGSLTESKK